MIPLSFQQQLTQLLPHSGQIISDYLQGTSAKVLAEKFNVKRSVIERLVKRAMAEYRVRHDHEIKGYLADVDSRLDHLMLQAWKLAVDVTLEAKDRIRAIAEVNHALSSKLTLAKLLQPKDEFAAQYIEVAFVTVKSREEKERIQNLVIDAEKFERIADAPDPLDLTALESTPVDPLSFDL